MRNAEKKATIRLTMDTPAEGSGVQPSARSVSNLSIEKLYRKRAIDRENQRLLRFVYAAFLGALTSLIPIRQKKKNKVVELEAELVQVKQRLAESEQKRRALEIKYSTTSAAVDSAIETLKTIRWQNGSRCTQNTTLFHAGGLLPLVDTPGGKVRNEQTVDGTVSSDASSMIAEPIETHFSNDLGAELWASGGFLSLPLFSNDSGDLSDCSLL
jgi:hypothetical protein